MIVLASVAAWVLTGCEKPASKTGNSPSSASSTSGSAASGTIPDTDPSAAVDDAFGQATVASAEALDLNEDNSSNGLDLLTGKIDTTITLRVWLRSHPADKISEVPPVEGLHDPFCRGAVARTHLMGRTLSRYALFYIPALSKTETLPTDTASAPGEYCELRTIVLVSEEMDFPRGHALRDSLALLIATRLGTPRDGLPLAAGGVRGTMEGKIWNGPGTKVMVATGPVDREPDPRAAREAEEDTAAVASAKPEPARTYAVAYAPGSGAQDFDTWRSRYEAQAPQRILDERQKLSDVDSALVWAAVNCLFWKPVSRSR